MPLRDVGNAPLVGNSVFDDAVPDKPDIVDVDVGVFIEVVVNGVETGVDAVTLATGYEVSGVTGKSNNGCSSSSREAVTVTGGRLGRSSVGYPDSQGKYSSCGATTCKTPS